MNQLAKLLLIAIIVFCCGSAVARQTIYVTRNSRSFNCPNYLSGILAAGGQNAVVLESVMTPVIYNYARNASGFYNNVSRVAVDGGGLLPNTNGKWFSYLRMRGNSHLWQVDANGQVINLNVVPTGGVFARLLPDNSYMVVDTDFVDTYSFSNNAWNRVDRFFYRNNSLNHMLPYFGLSNTGQSFVIMDRSWMSVQLYARKGQSWTYVENIPLNLTLGFAIALLPVGSGQDTMISTYYNYGPTQSVPAGAVVVHTKRNGQWHQTVTTALDLGLTAPASLGLLAVVLNQNNVLIGAPGDNFNSQTVTGGRVLLMQRQFDNSWKFTKDYVTNDKVMLGNALASTNQDVIIGGGTSSANFGGVCWMYTAPFPK